MGRRKQRDKAAVPRKLPRPVGRIRWLLGLAALGGALALAGTYALRAGSSDEADALSVGANEQAARRERLSHLQVPPDGAGLYRFMMKHIPDIVSEVECACCGEPLSACYQGRCPFT